MVRVLQGRDKRSVHTLIPDPRVRERGFHDVTIDEIEDSVEPAVSEDDLSLLRLQWSVTVLRRMVCLHKELDAMRASAKRQFRNSRPADCSYCGKWIKCDMYRHVDLGRFRKTVWTTSVGHTMCRRISNQLVLTDFVRHGLSGARFGQMPSLGVSTDVLLLSETQLALVHHNRVFRRGLPYQAYRRDYLSRLRVFISQAPALYQYGLISPVLGSSDSLRHVRPCDAETDVFTAGCGHLDFGKIP